MFGYLIFNPFPLFSVFSFLFFFTQETIIWPETLSINPITLKTTEKITIESMYP